MKPASSERASSDVDVAILGSGLSGATLAAILARHGKRVVMIESGEHPRFAIGESMILETSEVMRAAAEFFDVPELAEFSSEAFLSRVGTSHGVKRHFSFLVHREGRVDEPRDAIQAVIPRSPYGHELHLYRQDADYRLVTTAVSYGARLVQRAGPPRVEIEPGGVNLITAAGTLRARCVVDAGGMRSVLAASHGDKHRDLRTRSRGLFTHMVGVPCYNRRTRPRHDYGVPFPFSEGTLHHLFHGGWMWIIPFDNHPRSTNPVCSVGLMLDPELHPEGDEPPEVEFGRFVARYPGIARQLEGARAVRPWVRSGRIQYGTRTVVGDRFALLGHSAGFVDPLFSKGLYVSLTTVLWAAHLLLEGLRDDDLSHARLAPLERKTHAFLEANDRLVASAYRCFGDGALWRSYAVLWLLGAYLEYLKLASARVRAPDRDAYFRETAGLTLVGGGFPAFYDLSERVQRAVDSADVSDPASAARTAAEVRAELERFPWLPTAFRAILDGRTHLPERKLRAGLLRTSHGFAGSAEYRRHFFGPATLAEITGRFALERLRYGPVSALLAR